MWVNAFQLTWTVHMALPAYMEISIHAAQITMHEIINLKVVAAMHIFVATGRLHGNS